MWCDVNVVGLPLRPWSSAKTGRGTEPSPGAVARSCRSRTAPGHLRVKRRASLNWRWNEGPLVFSELNISKHDIVVYNDIYIYVYVYIHVYIYIIIYIYMNKYKYVVIYSDMGICSNVQEYVLIHSNLWWHIVIHSNP